MNYQLKVGEELPDRVRQILRKQIRRAASLLANRLDHRDEPVHGARKWLKKVRAMLRLVKPALGEDAWRREDRRFRRIARTLAGRRDAEVLTLTLKKLRHRRAKPAVHAALARLSHRVAGGRGKVPAKLRGQERKSRAQLRIARARVAGLPLARLGWRDLCRGLEETYRAGAAALAKAGRTRAPEDLHEWRKRVKDLWYQLQVVQPVQRLELGALAEDAKQLSLRLGDDHDLFLVEHAATTARLDRREVKRILDLTRGGHQELQEDAFALGRRLYAKAPADFARHLTRRPQTAQETR